MTAPTIATDDIVSAVLGNWGPWQRRSVLLIYLCKIPSAWFMACIIFTAPTPRPGEFFCKSTPNGSIVEQSGTWASPSSLSASVPPALLTHAARSKDFDTSELQLDYCQPLDERTNNTSEAGVPCTAFEHTAGFTSLVTQFDLVCSKTILIAVTQFFHLFGVLTGGILAVKLLEMWVTTLSRKRPKRLTTLCPVIVAARVRDP